MWGNIKTVKELNLGPEFFKEETLLSLLALPNFPDFTSVSWVPSLNRSHASVSHDILSWEFPECSRDLGCFCLAVNL